MAQTQQADRRSEYTSPTATAAVVALTRAEDLARQAGATLEVMVADSEAPCPVLVVPHAREV